MVVRRVLGTALVAVLVVSGVVWWQAGADARGRHDAAPAAHRGAETLGPVGYRKLRLGMTRAQVRRTHQATVARFDGGDCAGLALRAHRPGRDAVSGYVSRRYGLVAIFAAGRMHTPQGIQLGATRRQVKAAYPHLHKGIDASWVTVRHHPRSEYEFLFEGRGPKAKVYEMALTRKVQNCFN